MTFPKVSVYTYLGNDLLFNGLMNFIDMEYFQNFTADPGHASFSIIVPNTTEYQKLQDDFFRKLKNRYDGCDDEGNKIDGAKVVPEKDRVKKLFKTRKMNNIEKHEYQTKIIRELPSHDQILYKRIQNNTATKSEIDLFKSNQPDFFDKVIIDEVIECHWSFWPDDSSSLGYNLVSQSSDLLNERDGKDVKYSKEGEKFLEDVIERRAHGSNTFTYAPFGFVREAGLEEKDKKILNDYIYFNKLKSIIKNANVLAKKLIELKEFDENSKKLTETTLIRDQKIQEKKECELKIIKIKDNIKNLEEKTKEYRENLKNLENLEKQLKKIEEELTSSISKINDLKIKLSNEVKLSKNSMGILKRLIPNFEEVLFSHNISLDEIHSTKAADIFIEELNHRITPLFLDYNNLDKIVNDVTNLNRVKELEKDFIVYGGEPDSVTDLSISGPNGGKDGLNVQAMFDQMLTELTDGKGFELRTKNCSTTTNNVLLAGLKNNKNEDFLMTRMQNESSIAGIIVNPSSVHAGVLAIKKIIEEGNKSPNFFQKLLAFNPINRFAKEGKYYLALVKNINSNRIPFLEIIEGSRVKVPDWINNHLIKSGEERYFRAINNEKQQKIWQKDFIKKGIASNEEEAKEKLNELKKFINNVEKEFKSKQIEIWFKIIALSVPIFVAKRIFNPLKVLDEIGGFMKYAFSLKSKTPMAKVVKGVAVAAAIPAAIIAPFAGIQAIVNRGVKNISRAFNGFRSLFQKKKKEKVIKVKPSEYNKRFVQNIKNKQNVVEVIQHNTVDALKEFYKELSDKKDLKKIVTFDVSTMNEILKSIKNGENLKKMQAKINDAKNENNLAMQKITNLGYKIDNLKREIESKKKAKENPEVIAQKEKKLIIMQKKLLTHNKKIIKHFNGIKNLEKKLDKISQRSNSGKILDTKFLSEMYTNKFISNETFKSGLVEDVYRELSLASYERLQYINKQVKEELNLEEIPEYAEKPEKINIETIDEDYGSEMHTMLHAKTLAIDEAVYKYINQISRTYDFMYAFKEEFKNKYEIAIEIKKLNNKLNECKNFQENLKGVNPTYVATRTLNFLEKANKFKFRAYSILRTNGISDEKAKSMLRKAENLITNLRKKFSAKLPNACRIKVNNFMRFYRTVEKKILQKPTFDKNNKNLIAQINKHFSLILKLKKEFIKLGKFDFEYMNKKNSLSFVKKIRKNLLEISNHYEENFKNAISSMDKEEAEKYKDLLYEINPIQNEITDILNHYQDTEGLINEAENGIYFLSIDNAQLKNIDPNGFGQSKFLPELPEEHLSYEYAIVRKESKELDKKFQKMLNELDGGFAYDITNKFNVKEKGFNEYNFTNVIDKKMERLSELLSIYVSLCGKNFNITEYIEKHGLGFDKINNEKFKIIDKKYEKKQQLTNNMVAFDKSIVEKINLLKQGCINKNLENNLSKNARDQYALILESKSEIKKAKDINSLAKISEKLTSKLKSTKFKFGIELKLGKKINNLFFKNTKLKKFIKVAGLSRKNLRKLNSFTLLLEKEKKDIKDFTRPTKKTDLEQSESYKVKKKSRK